MSSSDNTNNLNNVIDLQKHRGKKAKKASGTEKSTFSAGVTDISNIRQEMINSERRSVRRTILTEFIGMNIIVPQKGLVKSALYDISENGLAFELPIDLGKFNVGEEVAMRIYMNHATYFPFVIKITHIRKDADEGLYLYGGSFIKNSINQVALFHFAKFVENISAYLKTDHGDVMVSNIGD
ncbi:MAG: PilZ domain-containing protein [Bdellovibrionales bacterium]|nr:PilZ domain-containing protein [Bdellovibrionales bacterium]